MLPADQSLDAANGSSRAIPAVGNEEQLATLDSVAKVATEASRYGLWLSFSAV